MCPPARLVHRFLNTVVYFSGVAETFVAVSSTNRETVGYSGAFLRGAFVIPWKCYVFALFRKILPLDATEALNFLEQVSLFGRDLFDGFGGTVQCDGTLVTVQTFFSADLQKK